MLTWDDVVQQVLLQLEPVLIQQTIRIEEVAQPDLLRTLITPIEEVIPQAEQCNPLQELDQRTEYSPLQEREAIVQVPEVVVLPEVAGTMCLRQQDQLAILIIPRQDLVLAHHLRLGAPIVLQPDQRRQEFQRALQDVVADRNSEYKKIKKSI